MERQFLTTQKVGNCLWGVWRPPLFLILGGSYVIAKRRGPKLTGKFIRMCEIYKIFSRDWKHICDYSEECMRELNMYESHGMGECKWNNGYFIGKQYMDVTLKMWMEDIRDGLLFKWELYEDDKYPTWWLDKVLRNCRQSIAD